MTRHSRGIRLGAFIAAAACATSLSACSSSSNSSTSPGSSSSNFAGQTIAVAAVTDYPPISFASPDGTTIEGVAVDILNGAAKEMGATFNLQDTSFDALIPSLLAGRQLIASGGATDTLTAQKATLMVDFMKVGVQLIVPAGNPKGITGLAGSCGFTVAVLAGSPTYQTLIQNASNACVAAGKPKINMSVFKTADLALLALQAGRTDAELDSSVLQSYRLQQGVKIEVVGETLAENPIAFQVLPANQALADALKNAIQSMMDNGTYKTTLAHWKMESGALPQAGINLGTSP